MGAVLAILVGALLLAKGMLTFLLFYGVFLYYPEIL